MGGGGSDGGAAVTSTYVTIQQAAVYACRDERTIRRWIADGRLQERRTATGRRVVVLHDLMVLEARVRSAPRRRQMERLADLMREV